MNYDPETKRLADAVTALAATMAEIINEKLRSAKDEFGARAQALEEKLATKKIEPLLTKKEVAQHYGIALRTVDCWIKKRYLPYYRLGRNIRFRVNEIETHWNRFYRIEGIGYGRGPHRAKKF